MSFLMRRLGFSARRKNWPRGKRILSPVDDPVAAAQISSLRSELSRIETFQRNIDLATSELASTETTIATAEDILNPPLEIAVRASNASMDEDG